MVGIGDTILFSKDGNKEKQGLVTDIQQREDNRYELLVKDCLGNCVILLEGDDTFLVLK